MDQNTRLQVAIIGSGNIGTDLMIKVLRNSKHLAMGAMVGIDAASDGLARAARMGVATTHEGINGLVNLTGFEQIRIVFDATSAGAHAKHNEILQQHGIKVIDLTPAAIGPYVVPVVNLRDHLASTNINMVTCGGQATIPVVRAISRVTRVRYAEIVASIASKSAGPGTRANIDEFTETTSHAIVSVGGAEHGKAIIVLNPAEPPLMMRDTVLCLAEGDADTNAIRESIEQMVKDVAAYVPGYRMKQDVQFDTIPADKPINIPGVGLVSGIKVSVFLEIEGAAHYLPAYAGNLDIMTSAALAAAEQIAANMIAAG
ncbi:acetaldehyde dehydrogenase (acetylating) [Pseudomonas reactans]|jgi:acetaldehyde dehydrogenase|uniref:Acetaldehyde dehydrogenase n=3 Tax=Pseudomonas TaxID=286 RepID=A0A7Y7ZGX8_9PSED|nr:MULTISPECIES: acetaldehyde dehydrogenase (acetylating) [Pseudomonas]ASV34844.1 acetaldehyde dehydrogenase (acetylating) [Pseudomonas sp. NS1(2017)]KGE68614.1 acetaldehyde dehydrogenase [Pseudomonas fluorescens LMG 5329]NWA45673.1 acetaldehyde dehydrogenase (acetylating) [Pseudomonas reactans]NWB30124.1 acetaldehyde dehydrogenase (acetylating) [Pseudomonas gingeri]NWC36598.1 acetaldehyde dehydrogenase (acetylating) [Pseudomonas gingeri]